LHRCPADRFRRLSRYHSRAIPLVPSCPPVLAQYGKQKGGNQRCQEPFCSLVILIRINMRGFVARKIKGDADLFSSFFLETYARIFMRLMSNQSFTVTYTD